MSRKFIFFFVLVIVLAAVTTTTLLKNKNVNSSNEEEEDSKAKFAWSLLEDVASRQSSTHEEKEINCRVNVHPAEMPCNELERRIASWPPVPPMAMPVEEMPMVVEWDFELLAQKALEHFKNNN